MSEMDQPGTVYLVGSGPGDPELLTLKAKWLLETADIVLHDNRPAQEIIEKITRRNARTSVSGPAAIEPLNR
jgi:siroheme synthase